MRLCYFVILLYCRWCVAQENIDLLSNSDEFDIKNLWSDEELHEVQQDTAIKTNLLKIGESFLNSEQRNIYNKNLEEVYASKQLHELNRKERDIQNETIEDGSGDSSQTDLVLESSSVSTTQSVPSSSSENASKEFYYITTVKPKSTKNKRKNKNKPVVKGTTEELEITTNLNLQEQDQKILSTDKEQMFEGSTTIGKTEMEQEIISSEALYVSTTPLIGDRNDNSTKPENVSNNTVDNGKEEFNDSKLILEDYPPIIKQESEITEIFNEMDISTTPQKLETTDKNETAEKPDSVPDNAILNGNKEFSKQPEDDSHKITSKMPKQRKQKNKQNKQNLREGGMKQNSKTNGTKEEVKSVNKTRTLNAKEELNSETKPEDSSQNLTMVTQTRLKKIGRKNVDSEHRIQTTQPYHEQLIDQDIPTKVTPYTVRESKADLKEANKLSGNGDDNLNAETGTESEQFTLTTRTRNRKNKTEGKKKKIPYQQQTDEELNREIHSDNFGIYSTMSPTLFSEDDKELNQERGNEQEDSSRISTIITSSAFKHNENEKKKTTSSRNSHKFHTGNEAESSFHKYTNLPRTTFQRSSRRTKTTQPPQEWETTFIQEELTTELNKETQKINKSFTYIESSILIYILFGSWIIFIFAQFCYMNFQRRNSEAKSSKLKAEEEEKLTIEQIRKLNSEPTLKDNSDPDDVDLRDIIRNPNSESVNIPESRATVYLHRIFYNTNIDVPTETNLDIQQSTATIQPNNNTNLYKLESGRRYGNIVNNFPINESSSSNFKLNIEQGSEKTLD